jgi:hypothetical protein
MNIKHTSEKTALLMILLVIAAACMLLAGCEDEKKAVEPENAASDKISDATSAEPPSAIETPAVPGEQNTGLENEDSGSESPESEPSSGSDAIAEPETPAETEVSEDFDLEYTLQDIDLILRRGMYFIVGNKAPAMDVITISSIKSTLSGKGIDTGDAKLADDISDYSKEDYIVIGSPCDNPVAAKLLAKEISKKGNCNIFAPGTAWIKIFQTSEDHIALYIGGGAAADTKKAGKVIENFDDYNLQGITVEVSGDTSSPELNMIIG